MLTKQERRNAITELFEGIAPEEARKILNSKPPDLDDEFIQEFGIVKAIKAIKESKKEVCSSMDTVENTGVDPLVSAFEDLVKQNPEAFIGIGLVQDALEESFRMSCEARRLKDETIELNGLEGYYSYLAKSFLGSESHSNVTPDEHSRALAQEFLQKREGLDEEAGRNVAPC